MNALENTISMMRVLPEAELVKIQDFTMKLFQHYKDGVVVENAAVITLKSSNNY